LEPIFEYVRDIILIICTIVLTYNSIVTRKKKKVGSTNLSNLFSFRTFLNIISVWSISIGIINPFGNLIISITMILGGFICYTYIFLSEKLYQERFEFIFYVIFILLISLYAILTLVEIIFLHIST